MFPFRLIAFHLCSPQLVVHGIFLLGRAKLFSVVFFFICGLTFFFGRLELSEEQLPTVDPLARTLKTVSRCNIVLRIPEFRESSNC